jgi:hypothetical protein
MTPTHGISDSIGEESFPNSDPATMACIDEHGSNVLSARSGGSGSRRRDALWQSESGCLFNQKSRLPAFGPLSGKRKDQQTKDRARGLAVGEERARANQTWQPFLWLACGSALGPRLSVPEPSARR